MKLRGNDVFDYIKKLSLGYFNAFKLKRAIIVEVKLDTLGDWTLTNNENPNGKYINYHAGPAPEVKYENNLIIKNNSKDPIYVLQKKYGKKLITQMSSDIKRLIK